jgi:hypothetical protein
MMAMAAMAPPMATADSQGVTATVTADVFLKDKPNSIPAPH